MRAAGDGRGVARGEGREAIATLPLLNTASLPISRYAQERRQPPPGGNPQGMAAPPRLQQDAADAWQPPRAVQQRTMRKWGKWIEMKISVTAILKFTYNLSCLESAI